MTKYNLTLPKMGESVEEATIVNWLKNIGDEIKADDFIVEVATDKVDSEVPCDVDGVLVEKCFEINDVVKVGETLCVIETSDTQQEKIIQAIPNLDLIVEDENNQEIIEAKENINKKSDDSFLSPLVRSIIDKEGISQNDLSKIKGSGKKGRLTKKDLFEFLGNKNTPNNKKIKIKILPKSKYRWIKTAMFFKNLAILGICHNPSQGDPGYVCNQPFVVNLHKIKITPGRAAIK